MVFVSIIAVEKSFSIKGQISTYFNRYGSRIIIFSIKSHSIFQTKLKPGTFHRTTLSYLQIGACLSFDCLFLSQLIKRIIAI